MNAAVWVELLKVRRSRMPWVTLLAFPVVALVGGLFMFILADQRRARSMGLLGAKATLVAGEADWPTYFGFLAQATAIGGLRVFGLVATWMFGREFSQDTIKDLLALPTGRTAIVGAKVLGLPGWSATVAVTGLTKLIGTAVMTMLLVTPVALAASVGRGYLPVVGVMLTAVFLAQIVATLGYGHYFPWSVPALFSGLAGPEREQAGLLGHVLVVGVGVGGVWATAAWWVLADQDR